MVTDQVTKYKSHLNLHGSKQELGVNYFETYTPVATWMAIYFLLIVAILNFLLEANGFHHGTCTGTY